MKSSLTALVVILSLSAHAAMEAGVFRFRLNSEPQTLDWTLARTQNETQIIMNLMEGLVDEGPDLLPRPRLAEKWEVSGDHLTLTFTLHKGVKWTDGVPLQARHFVDALTRLLDPNTTSIYAPFFYCIEGAEDYHKGTKIRAKLGVNAPNDRTLVIQLRRPTPYFLHLLTFPAAFPVRADLIRRYGKSWTEPAHLVTLGPYLLKSRVRGKTLTLKKNKNYWDQKPTTESNIETAEAEIEPNADRAAALFKAGRLDVLLEHLPQEQIRAPAEKGIRVEHYPLMSTDYLAFNSRVRPLDQPKVRRAFATAIDRATLPQVLAGFATAAISFVPHEIIGSAESLKVQGTLFEARGDLLRAGFGGGQGFPKLNLLVEKFEGAEQLAAALTQSFKQKLGIEIIPDIKESRDYLKALRLGEQALYVDHWDADFSDPINFLEVYDSSNRMQWTHWTSSRYDGLLGQARGEADDDRRDSLFADAEKYLIEDQAIISPLYHRQLSVRVRNRVSRFTVSPLKVIVLKQVKLEP